MLIFNEGGGGTVVDNGVVVMGGRGRGINKCSVACQTINSYQGSSISHYTFFNLEKS